MELADNDIVDVKVFAIEMVYVPQGSFYVGMGGTSTATFFTLARLLPVHTLFPVKIEIPVGMNTGDLYY